MPQHDPIPSRRGDDTQRRGIANPHAWARYRRLMSWMALIAMLFVCAALAWLRWTGVPTPLPMIIATAAGLFTTIMVGTGLMSLIFLSAGSGHDADADDPFDQRH